MYMRRQNDTALVGDVGQQIMEELRVLLVAGISAGVVLVGLGSRAAMLVLRLTSPHRVRGVLSDDGFVIGRVTLAGTYNLLLLGAAVGIIGAGVYRLVAPSLIGPIWFRRVTTGLASGAVVGSMLIHSDGIDFTLLGPTWLAIALFIALPGVFGAFVGSVVDAVARPDSWTSRGRLRWLLPLVCLACFPAALFVLLVAVPILGICILVGRIDALQRVRSFPHYRLMIRGMWLSIAVIGLIAVVNDTRDIVTAAAFASGA